MPIYEYKCVVEKCAHEFDQIQKLSDEPLKVCPKCQAEGLIKVIGGRTVIKMTGIRY